MAPLVPLRYKWIAVVTDISPLSPMHHLVSIVNIGSLMDHHWLTLAILTVILQFNGANGYQWRSPLAPLSMGCALGTT
jgi:hypothetical protein